MRLPDQEALLARRWFIFNGVGIAGFVVQLAALWLLVVAGGWPYLAATALAVECALLFNFALHERWTWRDRPAIGTASRLSRLWRFHLVNGSVSMAGNLVVMAALTGSVGVPPLAANTIAVLACSLVNFAGSDRLIFRPLAASSPR